MTLLTGSRAESPERRRPRDGINYPPPPSQSAPPAAALAPSNAITAPSGCPRAHRGYTPPSPPPEEGAVITARLCWGLIIYRDIIR